ncbi:hypothetical protein THRCLA_22752 [Thraustotheca clavata]|uniref:Uncharacterized protein n=1 Tax=Thraustotheca clavata TaxID=74557 RepID=A0A1V9YU19_9STRA|nr:hypothetical protein THRCLA_22752 [Thraustotheca clavata]
MLNERASANHKDKGGERPLHVAASNGHNEVAKLLIKPGALMDAKTIVMTFLSAAGATPAHKAARGGYNEVVEPLLKAGGLKAWTPLHFAADKGNGSSCQLLINAGASTKA